MTNTNWLAAAVAILLGVVAATYIGKLPPAIPVLRAEYQLSLPAIGWLNWLGWPGNGRKATKRMT